MRVCVITLQLSEFENDNFIKIIKAKNTSHRDNQHILLSFSISNERSIANQFDGWFSLVVCFVFMSACVCEFQSVGDVQRTGCRVKKALG